MYKTRVGIYSPKCSSLHIQHFFFVISYYIQHLLDICLISYETKPLNHCLFMNYTPRTLAPNSDLSGDHRAPGADPPHRSPDLREHTLHRDRNSGGLSRQRPAHDGCLGCVAPAAVHYIIRGLFRRIHRPFSEEFCWVEMRWLGGRECVGTALRLVDR